jgi:hypothetical protein
MPRLGTRPRAHERNPEISPQAGQPDGESGRPVASLLRVGRSYAHPSAAAGTQHADGFARSAKLSTSTGKSPCTGRYRPPPKQPLRYTANHPANLPSMTRIGSQLQRESSTRTSLERSCISSQGSATNGYASATRQARSGRRHTFCAHFSVAIMASSGFRRPWTAAAPNGGVMSNPPARSALNSRSSNGSRG